ncbi:MAG: molecular chaperone HtpG [Alphaproteobacteria bacterium]
MKPASQEELNSTQTPSSRIYPFQAEVSRLLSLVVNALYSNKEIFLRELVSNAADACDRLRYAAITQPELLGSDPQCKVTIRADKKAKTLTITDNGIGMDEDTLINNLGVIARSGTAEFLAALQDKSAVAQIGQFGVGFYSAFMVAEEVEVISCLAGSSQSYSWKSKGAGEFEVGIAAIPRIGRGTDIILHLKDDALDYLDEPRIRYLIGQYADHIAVPIFLDAAEGQIQLNKATALWARPKNEITPEQYTEFYRHIAHRGDEPLLNLHWKAEGVVDYTCLLYVPSEKPMDLFDPRRHHSVKLYVKKIFINETAEGLIPPFLRFLQGVVDSEDLPLNVSREMLQHNPVLSKIRHGIARRILGELYRTSQDNAEKYLQIWDNFGSVIKEGLYEESQYHDEIHKLLRFHSTASDQLVSLEQYVGRIQEGQEHIYVLYADELTAARKSPQLEGFISRGIEVLLLTDPIDEFWVPLIGKYKGLPFQSITKAGVNIDNLGKKPEEEADKPANEAVEAGTKLVLDLCRLTLGQMVKDIRPSSRLTHSAACLVAEEGDVDIHLEKLLKQHKKMDSGAKRVLEINPTHPLILSLAEAITKEGMKPAHENLIWLIYDQARIMEGELPSDPAAFATRLGEVLKNSIQPAA